MIGEYTTFCQQDFPGNDELGSQTADSFEACIPICDSTPGVCHRALQFAFNLFENLLTLWL
jgi:hypothetical protein